MPGGGKAGQAAANDGNAGRMRSGCHGEKRLLRVHASGYLINYCNAACAWQASDDLLAWQMSV
jgi:endonuclease IV